MGLEVIPCQNEGNDLVDKILNKKGDHYGIIDQ